MRSKLLPWLCVALLVPFLSGCVAVAAASVVGIGFVQYHRNEAVRDFPDELDVTWHATLEAMKKLGYEDLESELIATEGIITQDDVEVRVERHPEAFTRVRIRVGTFSTTDHHRRAQLIHDEIERALLRSDELDEWKSKVESLSEPDGSEAPETEAP